MPNVSKLGNRSDTAALISWPQGFSHEALLFNPAAAGNPASQRYDTAERTVVIIVQNVIHCESPLQCLTKVKYPYVFLRI